MEVSWNCIRSQLYSIYNTLYDFKFVHFRVVNNTWTVFLILELRTEYCRESRKEGLMSRRKTRRPGVRQRNVLSSHQVGSQSTNFHEARSSEPAMNGGVSKLQAHASCDERVKYVLSDDTCTWAKMTDNIDEQKWPTIGHFCVLSVTKHG